jgi:hypothetical protein
MTQNQLKQSKGLEFFHTKKVVTLSELAVYLHCSKRTVHRRLAAWQAITSYNKNGARYTLPDIATFDANGIWRYRGSFFSRFGNLPKTFVQLVSNSEAGLTASESGALLGLRPSSFMWSLRDYPGFKREKHKGLYVYYSSEPTCYRKQKAQRKLVRRKTRSPVNSEAVAILVEKIKYPNLSNEELSIRLRNQKIAIAPEVIENLFVKHDLTVKKTPHLI